MPSRLTREDGARHAPSRRLVLNRQDSGSPAAVWAFCKGGMPAKIPRIFSVAASASRSELDFVQR